MFESCIVHPAFSRSVFIRESYLRITEDACSALILSHLEHWFNLEFQNTEFESRYSYTNKYEHVHQSEDFISENLFCLFSQKEISDHLVDLDFKGLIKITDRSETGYILDCRIVIDKVQQTINDAYRNNTKGSFWFGLPKRDPSMAVEPVKELPAPAPNRTPITRDQRFRVLKRDKYTCTYCGRSAPEVKLQVDHKVSRINGGPTLDINLTTSCADCNGGKGAQNA